MKIVPQIVTFLVIVVVGGYAYHNHDAFRALMNDIAHELHLLDTERINPEVNPLPAITDDSADTTGSAVISQSEKPVHDEPVDQAERPIIEVPQARIVPVQAIAASGNQPGIAPLAHANEEIDTSGNAVDTDRAQPVVSDASVADQEVGTSGNVVDTDRAQPVVSGASVADQEVGTSGNAVDTDRAQPVVSDASVADQEIGVSGKAVDTDRAQPVPLDQSKKTGFAPGIAQSFRLPANSAGKPSRVSAIEESATAVRSSQESDTPGHNEVKASAGAKQDISANLPVASVGQDTVSVMPDEAPPYAAISSVREALKQARITWALGEQTQAIMLYQAFMKKYPDHPDFPGELGNVHFGRGETRAAVVAYSEAFYRLLRMGERKRAAAVISLMYNIDSRQAAVLRNSFLR